jgi:TetR/AcrR family transcriptional regulator, cholesterol catabolism regulator
MPLQSNPFQSDPFQSDPIRSDPLRSDPVRSDPVPNGDLVSPPPGLRERNKAEKWRRIVEAASRLFASQGFEATTTAAIAEKAGIGTGTLYLYVTSKEDLLVAVFRDEVGRLWDDAFAAVDRHAPVVDQMLSAFGRVIAYHEQEPALARIYFKELMFVSPAMRAGVSDFMRQYFGQLGDLLDQAKANGLLDPEVPSLILAHNLWAQFYQLMQRRYATNMDPAAVVHALEGGFRVALWGMVPQLPVHPA